MNRLDFELEVPAELSTHTSPSVNAAAATFKKLPTGVAVFSPLHYEPNYRYPLLVWLHGPRDHEGQLRRIMPLVSMRNYVAVAPRGVSMGPTAPADLCTWNESEDDIFAAVDSVDEAIRHAGARFNLAPNRIFLAGFDVGGTMAFRIAMQNPERYAGVISVGGRFPTSGRPLARVNSARRMPVFIACGRESRRYPTPTVCGDLRLLHAAGMNITLRQYPGGHDISPLMLADMDRWMMEEITAECAV